MHLAYEKKETDMVENDPCEICGTSSRPMQRPNYDGIGQECPRCQKFWITGSALSSVRHAPPKVKSELSGWVYDQNALGTEPEVTSNTVDFIKKQPTLGLVEKSNRLLLAMLKYHIEYGQNIYIEEPYLISAIHGKDKNEVQFVVRMLEDSGLLIAPGAIDLRRITPKGHIHAETISAKQVASSQGFVAMWFKEELDEVYELGFASGVRLAGYDPVRGDNVEHVNKIDDEIIVQIRRSKFVVADFTGQRGGVYFEAGYALGLGLPVIWSCRQTEVKDLHFDVRQFNCITWNNADELSKKLQIRIEAVIGDGPRKSS